MTGVTAVRTLVAWVPDWPVVAAGAGPDEPAAVVHANRVVAVTPAARVEGVDAGLRRREAQGRCPGLRVIDHDPARDTRAWEPIVACFDDICPRIEIAAPGRLAFPTRGPSRYFGGDAPLADIVATRVPGGAVGIADGPFAAWLAARLSFFGGSPGSIPGESPKNGRGCATLVIQPLSSATFLAPLSVDHLLLAGLPDELIDVLRRLGLRTLGAVAALPAGDVAGRFGPDGIVAHRLASGRDERPPATEAPPADLAVRAELDPPAERVETAAFVARGLADELTRRLDALGTACTRLLVAAETEHGERLERLWRGDGAGGAAALSAGAIADRVRWQLDGWITAGRRSPADDAVGSRSPADDAVGSRSPADDAVAPNNAGHRPTAGITLLELVPDETIPATGRQLGFWGGTAGADERAVRAVARIAGLLGPDAVTVPEWRGGRAPAEQIALVPAGAVDLAEGRAAARPDAVTAPWPGRLPSPDPAALARDVVEVLAADGSPVGVTGRGSITADPARLVVDGRPVDVAAWAGPWPAEERWWDPAGSRRRARLQVVDATGTARLLCREDGSWWLEAIYD